MQLSKTLCELYAKRQEPRQEFLQAHVCQEREKSPWGRHTAFYSTMSCFLLLYSMILSSILLLLY